jgi:hypothetical protein
VLVRTPEEAGRLGNGCDRAGSATGANEIIHEQENDQPRDRRMV